jgi:alpha-tubulin N-acetyltransferase 1
MEPEGSLEEGVSVWDAAALRLAPGADAAARAIDALGFASAAAQQIPCAFTSAEKLAAGQRIYLFSSDAEIRGLLKVGPKHLYYWRKDGSQIEIDALCVLDFYVVEAAQRAGVGRRLFDAALAREDVDARRLAYDKPSAKMLPFLKKHYGLEAHAPQPNNFVIFDAFFDAPR